uniref:F-box domain-containing protein n=1 Tax=Stomoxys calcitrans TaxID=35570 RepID=A0A1I8NPK1_STOCA
MSSISAQGVVERASAELSKRINGLGLRSKHHHGSSSSNNSSSGGGSNNSSSTPANSGSNSNQNNTSGGPNTTSSNSNSSTNSSNSSSASSSVSSSSSSSSSSASSGTGKTSVMERVTNALCGGNSNSNANANANSNQTQNNSNLTATTNSTTGQTTPDKPTRAGTLNAGAQQQQQQSAQLHSPQTLVQHHTTTVTSYQLLQQQKSQQQLQQHQQYLSSQIANSTLINSNLMNTTPPTVPNIPMGAPPTPTVNSIAKQMNITIPGSPQFTTMGMAAAQKSQSVTPLQMRKQLPNPHMHHPYAGASQAATQLAQAVTQSALILPKLPPPVTSIESLMMDERFLNKFFLYFTSYERRVLAQVCMKWRDVLYRSPRFWSGLLPTLQCRELRQINATDRVKLFNSLIRRGFHALALVGANDDDAYDVVHSFTLASKHIHSLSLRCSSISDRGLEALLDHLQVSE